MERKTISFKLTIKVSNKVTINSIVVVLIIFHVPFRRSVLLEYENRLTGGERQPDGYRTVRVYLVIGRNIGNFIKEKTTRHGLHLVVIAFVGDVFS